MDTVHKCDGWTLADGTAHHLHTALCGKNYSEFIKYTHVVLYGSIGLDDLEW